MTAEKDLLLLVADKDAQFALKGALSRPQALGIREITYEFRVHTGRDGGARKTGPAMLALERRRFSHALLIFDLEGCGAEHFGALKLEEKLDLELSGHWQDAAKSIVIEPEVDVWMWGSDNAIANVINWPSGRSIREWLIHEGFALDAKGKPIEPKEAMHAALRVPNLPRSAALYQSIAEKISLRHCTDAAFLRLRSTLTRWFPS